MKRWILFSAIALGALAGWTARGEASDGGEALEAGGDVRKQYFVFPSGEATRLDRPLGLVVVLPGGEGNAQFKQFVGWLAKMGVPDGYLVAELVATLWFPEQQVVWPTHLGNEKGIGFVTQDFIDAVIDEVSSQYQIDARRIYLLAWSSGGPAVQEYLLTRDWVRGAVLAASSFWPQYMPPLAGARGKSICLLHSRDDTVVTLDKSERAYQAFTEAGARVFLEVSPGEHMDWGKPRFRPLRDCMRWIETNDDSIVVWTPAARVQ